MKKKMIGLMLALALAVGICPAAFAASAPIPQNDVLEIQPREILTQSKSQIVTVGANKEYMAIITVKYTVRPESSNSSGYYITGVLSASIQNLKGWTSVGAANINTNGIVYSQNHQQAVVPVTYEASIGEGYSTYSNTITINL